FVPERGAVRPSLRGILMAIGSGIAIGAFFVTIDQTSEESGIVPLLLNRAVTAVIMFAAVAVLAVVAARRARLRVAGAAPAPAAAVAADGERMPQQASLVTAVAPARSATAAGVRLAIACGVVDV